MRSRLITNIAVLVFIILTIGCSNKSEKLIIFHAGSLTVPFEQIIEEFQKEHPNLVIEKEIAGSRACARKIAEIHKPCDVMASADYSVINNLLIPEHASWNIKFASNEMALVFTKNSIGSKEINKENWYEFLLNEKVNYGRSDPNADPCGYRTVLTMKLAEKFYEIDGLASTLIEKNKKYIRPKETDLLALLEAGELDYIFLYRSVAEQHGLDYVLLPDEINLKKPELNEFYKEAEVKISGKKPGETITKKGAPMVYGITIPQNAPNHPMAEEFVKFVLSKEKGMKIMENNGQPSVVPSVSDTYDQIPNELKKFAVKN